MTLFSLKEAQEGSYQYIQIHCRSCTMVQREQMKLWLQDLAISGLNLTLLNCLPASTTLLRVPPLSRDMFSINFFSLQKWPLFMRFQFQQTGIFSHIHFVRKFNTTVMVNDMLPAKICYLLNQYGKLQANKYIHADLSTCMAYFFRLFFPIRGCFFYLPRTVRNPSFCSFICDCLLQSRI